MSSIRTHTPSSLFAQRRQWLAAFMGATLMLLAPLSHAAPVDDAVQERFEAVVATLVDGIEGGDFPANPGEEAFRGPTHCGFCDFNRVCPSSRVDLWEGVRRDPALERYVELAEGELP